jgi:hypothetical protein
LNSGFQKTFSSGTPDASTPALDAETLIGFEENPSFRIEGSLEPIRRLPNPASVPGFNREPIRRLQDSLPLRGGSKTSPSPVGTTIPTTGETDIAGDIQHFPFFPSSES